LNLSLRRVARCTEPHCGGELVRRSLGCGLSTHRCVRCFRSVDLGRSPAALADRPALGSFALNDAEGRCATLN
jgi:hypothetical protein